MPAGFERCAAGGGRVRTKTLPEGKYQRFCYKGGKSYAGEVKKSSVLTRANKGK